MAGTTSNQAPAPRQPMGTPVMQSLISPIPPNTELTNYCEICIPLQKICCNELPMSLDLDIDDKEEEKTRINEKIKRTVNGRHPKPAPDSYWLLPLVLNSPNSPSNSSARAPV